MPDRTNSLVNPASSRSLAGSNILPWPSSGHSVAAPSRYLLNDRTLGGPNWKRLNCSSILRHSSKGYAARQERRLVTIKGPSYFTLKTSLKRLGMLRRPLASKTWADRPLNTTLYPFIPLYTTYRHYIGTRIYLSSGVRKNTDETFQDVT